MAVPDSVHYRTALDRGDTLVRRPHIHWITSSRAAWIKRQRALGTVIMAVELADDAMPLTRLDPHHRAPRPRARRRAGGRVGAARPGVEIPMVGRGASLNVAVAGSLVLYRLAGLY